MPILIDPNASAPRPTSLASYATSPSNDELEAIALAKAPPAKSRQSSSLLGLLSLVAFVVLGRGSQSPRELALLVVVLFFHEAGHIAGMHAFGYRDVRMLFIPYMGALASGTKSHAPGWQHAIVLLLGPLPGLVLSLALFSMSVTGIWRALAAQLLFINGFNLFPLVPLDGGRFIQQLFAAYPRAQAAFSAIGVLIFGLLSMRSDNWLMVGFAILLPSVIRLHLDVAKHGLAIRGAWGAVPPIADISDAQARELYSRADEVAATPWPKPAVSATIMRQIHEHASTEPMSASTAAALVGAYAAGFAVILVDLMLLRVR
jgi:Zn-dependent protease